MDKKTYRNIVKYLNVISYSKGSHISSEAQADLAQIMVNLQPKPS